ncbi:hypothetical protein, partial [Morganella morganii]
MIAIVFPHVYCNDGIITDLSGYGFIPENLGLGEKFQPKGNYLPFRTVNKLPGRGFTGAFSGDVNTTYV